MVDRNSRKNTVIIILVILVLGLAGFSSYLMFFKENDTSDVKCKDDKTEEKVVDNTSVKNKIEIYGKKHDSEAYFICNHKSDTDVCKNVLFTIETETSNANIIHLSLSSDSSFPYIVYNDNGVKLYDVKENKSTKIDIDINGDIIWLDEGFIKNGEEDAFYYSLKDNKKVYEKYDELLVIKDENSANQINPKYLSSKKGSNTLVIDFKTGNVIITIENKDLEGISFEKSGDYIIAKLNSTEETKTVIYNTKGEKIIELEKNQNYVTQGSKLIINEIEEKKVKEY